MDTAITFCRSAGATGRAAVAQRSAMRASARGSVVVSPTTDGISSTSRDRFSAEVLSLTSRAAEATSACVHVGWSLHRSPARYDAISMKQAPRRELRCLPRERFGTRSGMLGADDRRTTHLRHKWFVGSIVHPRGGSRLARFGRVGPSLHRHGVITTLP